MNGKFSTEPVEFEVRMDKPSMRKLLHIANEIDIDETKSFKISQYGREAEYVKVDHCKDCKNYSGEGMYCGWNMIARADGYCFHANEKPVYEDD